MGGRARGGDGHLRASRARRASRHCRSRRASGRSPRPWPSSWRSSPGSATASASGSRCRSSTPRCWPSAPGGLLVNGKPDGARPDDPWGGQFQCGDGRWVRLSLATFRFVQRFVEAAGRSDWIQKGYVTPERPGPLARGTELRERQQAELLALFRRHTALEWEDLGRRASVPITMVRTSAEWLAAEHPRTAGVVAEVADPALGPMLQPGLAVRLFATPGAIRPRPRDASAREHGPRGSAFRASGLTIGADARGAGARRRPRRGPHPGARRPHRDAHAGRVRRRRREDQQSRQRKGRAIAGRFIAITPTSTEGSARSCSI